MTQQQQPVYYVQTPQQRGIGCLWAMAAFGLLAIVVFLWALWGTMNIAADVNQVPAVLEQAVMTLQPQQVQPGQGLTIATVTPAPAIVLEPVATATAYPTSTNVPAPTRPAIETLPDGEGPYTAQQMQVCRDVWVQSLQAELTVHQFGYCKGVVER